MRIAGREHGLSCLEDQKRKKRRKQTRPQWWRTRSYWGFIPWSAGTVPRRSTADALSFLTAMLFIIANRTVIIFHANFFSIHMFRADSAPGLRAGLCLRGVLALII